jgi:hypothetical protein
VQVVLAIGIMASGVQRFLDALAIAISSSMRARCALPGQTVSFGITAASVGHHSNCPCLPNDVPTKSTQPTEGSKVHPPSTTFTVTGHFGHLIAMAQSAFLKSTYFASDWQDRLDAFFGDNGTVP